MVDIDKPKIFTVIVTYNSEQYIRQCLECLKESSYMTEIVVVDNASGDKTTEIIKASFPDVKLVMLDHNIGFGAGNNLGMQYALENDADYVFLLNGDCYVDKDCIGKIIHAFLHEDNSKLGVISPVQLNGKGNLVDSNFFKFLIGNPKSANELFSSVCTNNNEDKVRLFDFVNAAAWVLSRACIENVGGFDAIFGLAYGEDDNYIHRVLYHGYKLGVLPEALVRHDREDRKTPNVSWYEMMQYKTMLKLLTNINESLFFAVLLKFCFSTLSSFFKYVFSCKMKASIFTVKNFFKCLLKLPEIYKSRKNNRQGSHLYVPEL